MKKSILILSAIIFIVSGCNRTNKTTDVPRPVCFTDLKTLNRLLPNIISCLETGNEQALSDSVLQQLFSDTAIYRAEDGTIRNEEDLLVVTKAIDDKHIFAIAGNNADTLLLFFRLQNGQWKEIGRRKPEIPVNMVNFEELNGKPYDEIVVGTYPNMNGNSWKECFVYFPEEDSIKYAGSFCTDYTVDLKNRTLSEDYEGSFYMNPHKILYGWHNDKLIPLREAEIIVPEDWNTNETRLLEYYETNDYSRPIKRIFSEIFDSSNRKHLKYWEHFFETPNIKIQSLLTDKNFNQGTTPPKGFIPKLYLCNCKTQETTSWAKIQQKI